jgi:hypothetical protein
MFGSFEVAFNESLVDDHLGSQHYIAPIEVRRPLVEVRHPNIADAITNAVRRPTRRSSRFSAHARKNSSSGTAVKKKIPTHLSAAAPNPGWLA